MISELTGVYDIETVGVLHETPCRISLLLPHSRMNSSETGGVYLEHSEGRLSFSFLSGIYDLEGQEFSDLNLPFPERKFPC